MKRWKFALSAIALAVMPVMGFATDPNSDAQVLLQVEIQSTAGSEGVITQFNLADLQALPTVSFETETIWTEGVQRFTGVSLAALTRHLGVNEGTLLFQAINDYSAEIPVSYAVDGGPIVAYQRNGALMSTRDKGPLWIIFPFDSNPAYKTEEIFSKSVWQLVRIVIKPDS
ncbi:MAG: oxidoreductase [Rhodobacteraceae bacterium]|nr:MAG: oxidoreductase [Paracoccaceae bacterium]